MSVGSSNEQASREFQQSELRGLEKAIRRIVRAHDLLSKALVKASGLTSAQLVVLKGIEALGEVTTTALSVYADISPATMVTILDNLEERGLIERYRSLNDRRIVHTRLTQAGRGVVARAPEPLGETLAGRYSALPLGQRRQILETANRLADLMERDRPGRDEGNRRLRSGPDAAGDVINPN